MGRDEGTPGQVVASGGGRETTYRALRLLIDHLADSSAVLGFKVDRTTGIVEMVDEMGVAGHSMSFSAPYTGFSEEQKRRIEGYAEALTYWHHLLLEITWEEKSVSIAYRYSEKKPDREKEKGNGLGDTLLTRPFKAARAIGKALVDQGFRAREPIAAKLITASFQVKGWAIMIKYPFSREADQAGVNEVYDRLVPLIADAFARDFALRCEVVQDSGITTIFFTGNKRYVSSLYGARTGFRLIAMRKKTLNVLELGFLQGSTFRACRALNRQYKKDFVFLKRPLPALGLRGHTLVLRYKPGAGGNVVDQSYFLIVRRMTEKLMDRYRVQASIKHSIESRSIMVTFHNGLENEWGSASAYVS